MHSENQLDSAERQALAREYDRIASQPRTVNYGPVGCVVALLAAVLLLVIPVLARKFFPQPPAALVWIIRGLGALLALTVLGGLAVGLFGGGRGESKSRQLAEDAMDWLARNHSSAPLAERRRFAVTILFHAYYSGGPYTVTTFASADARLRLGDALPYVLAVERALRRERNIYPVFTADDPLPLPD
ncbi:MAG: hypothetical protein ACRD2R_00185 [Terriglobales bacterium]